jgi:hypothetical protein
VMSEMSIRFSLTLLHAGFLAQVGWGGTGLMDVLGEVYGQGSGTWPDAQSPGEQRGQISETAILGPWIPATAANLGTMTLQTNGTVRSRGIRSGADYGGDNPELRVSVFYTWAFMDLSGAAQWIWSFTGRLRALWESEVAP